MIPNSLKSKFTFCLNLTAFVIALNIIGTSSAQAKNILVFGDSLSAAYGMELEQGWAHLLGETLGDSYTLNNASISGETSGGGRARFQLTLEEFKPDLVILELGANDGLQGLSLKGLRNNLNSMIEMAKKNGALVVVAGISLPPSYGPRYIDSFRAIFTDLASDQKLPFIDLYREEFFDNPGYIQADGLHPTVVTQPLIRDLVLTFLNENNLLD